MRNFRSTPSTQRSVEKRLIDYLKEETKDTVYDISELIYVHTPDTGKSYNTVMFFGKTIAYKYFIYYNGKDEAMKTVNQLEKIALFLQKRVYFYSMIIRPREELLVNLRIAVTRLEKTSLSRGEKDAIFDSLTESFYIMYKLVNDWYLEYVEKLPFGPTNSAIPF